MHPAVPIAVPQMLGQVSHSFTSSRSPPLQPSRFRKPVLPEEPPKAKAVELCSSAPSTGGGGGGITTKGQAVLQEGLWSWGVGLGRSPVPSPLRQGG